MKSLFPLLRKKRWNTVKLLNKLMLRLRFISLPWQSVKSITPGLRHVKSLLLLWNLHRHLLDSYSEGSPKFSGAFTNRITSIPSTCVSSSKTAAKDLFKLHFVDKLLIKYLIYDNDEMDRQSNIEISTGKKKNTVFICNIFLMVLLTNYIFLNNTSYYIK